MEHSTCPFFHSYDFNAGNCDTMQVMTRFGMTKGGRLRMRGVSFSRVMFPKITRAADICYENCKC